MKQETKFKDTEIGMIPEDWEETTLGSVVTFQRGYDLPLKDRKEGPYPIIMSNGIGGNHNEFKVKGPGITIGRSGNLGQPFYTEKDYWPHNTTLYVKKFENSNPKFMYYFLKRLKLNRFNAGSAVPTLNRNHIHPILIIIPRKIEEQKAIAKILSDLDSKIELLQKQNKTLEAIGQAIFKHWFVDFEFPNEEGKPYKSSGGEMVFNEELGKDIPKGWEVKPLDRIANFLNGLALQKFPPEGDDFLPVIKIKELRQGISEQSDKASPNIDKKYIINDGDVLFSWSGTLMVVIWGEGKGALNQHLFKVTSENFEKWFYYYWIKNHLRKFIGIAKDKTTTMGHIKRHHLTDSKVLVPNDVIFERMNEIMNSFTHKKIKNKLELRMLISLRDTLLPKLMSGEIRVNNLEAGIE